MLVERKLYNDTDGTLGYIESVFSSSNILKTTYFPKQQRLYLAFNRGKMYSYENVDNELYSEFENSESQGVFFSKKISKNKNYPFREEFTLYPEEIKGFKLIVENFNKNLDNDNLNEDDE